MGFSNTIQSLKQLRGFFVQRWQNFTIWYQRFVDKFVESHSMEVGMVYHHPWDKCSERRGEGKRRGL